MFFLFFPGSQERILESDLLFQRLAQSVTWRGKLLASQSWRRVCRQQNWIEPLFTSMSELLEVPTGVEQWISSLRASRVSPGHSPEKEREHLTTAGSGTTSPGLSTRRNLPLFSWRTSQGWLMGDLSTSASRWPKQGSMRNGVVFQRPKWEPSTSARDCSYWPTMDAGVSTGYNQSASVGSSIRPNLAGLVRYWATSKAQDSVGSRQVGYRYPNFSPGETLTDQIRMWSTSMVADADKQVPSSYRGSNLLNDMQRWATASARDWRDGRNVSCWDNARPLNEQDTAFGLQTETPTTGVASRKPSGPQLNVTFVEHLQGFRTGWTGFGPLETLLAPYTQPFHLEFWRLVADCT